MDISNELKLNDRPIWNHLKKKKKKRILREVADKKMSCGPNPLP